LVFGPKGAIKGTPKDFALHKIMLCTNKPKVMPKKPAIAARKT